MYTESELAEIKLARAQRIQREQAARYAAQQRFERENAPAPANAAGLVVTLAIAAVAAYGLWGGVQWAQ
jgi:hypothetical protein